jgi:SOS-response transcriptional repressor LexA
VNINWLLTGEGEMYLSNQGKVLEKASESYKVPLLRQKASCGNGQHWEDERNIEEYIDIFTKIPRLASGRLFALLVHGSSMLGAGIEDGDYVLFDSNPGQIPKDGNYVIALDGDVLCKRLEHEKTKTIDKIKIFSVRAAELKNAEPIAELNKNEQIDRLHIFGRVIGLLRPTF